MAYLLESEMIEMKFKFLGKNVKISDKASIYDTEQVSIGDNSRIDDFCVISGRIEIGKNVHLAPFCLLAGGTEGIRMEDFSGCAYHVQVFTQSDDYTGRTLTNPTIPNEYKNEVKKPVYIESHVIVGTSSVIFPGVTLSEGCAIGAMALVNKSTLAWGVYIGNPAKRVKERKKDLLKLEKKFLAEER